MRHDSGSSSTSDQEDQAPEAFRGEPPEQMTLADLVESEPGPTLPSVTELPSARAPAEKNPIGAALKTTPRVAALIVTWNRKEALDVVLLALTKQHYPLDRLDVVVIDNASTDSTSDHVIARWGPTSVVDNPTDRADEPAFSMRAPVSRPATGQGSGAPRAHPFASLTLIVNRLNHGGCGGFNTGLAFAEQFLDPASSPLDYAWLVDDDVDLPPGALSQLVKTGESDASIGLVGSRTVDFSDRRTTIETTIYFDAERGSMGPTPHPGHRLEASHAQWAERMGGTRGDLPFSGVREVDVVSACSLLARWSAVKKVGFWDSRYFIYCDDADWSLRFPRSGYKVVCDLDAVVYHTYWLTKLTPVRGYYAGRNLLWLLQKVTTGEQLRAVTFRRLAGILLDARKAMTHCRLFHAEIFRRTAHDVATNRGGKLSDEGPPAKPVLEVLEGSNLLRATAHLAVMCSHADSIAWATEFRARLSEALRVRGTPEAMPRFTDVCRDGVPMHEPAHGLLGGHGSPRRVVFRPRRGSKLAMQWWLFRDPPDAVLIFDQHNDCPLVWSRRNVHVDRRRPGVAQIERDGWLERGAFLVRWVGTAIRCAWHAWRVKPYQRTTKYG